MQQNLGHSRHKLGIHKCTVLKIINLSPICTCGVPYGPTFYLGNPSVRKIPPPLLLGKRPSMADFIIVVYFCAHNYIYGTHEFSAKCLGSSVIMQVIVAFRGSKLSQKITLRAIQLGRSVGLADCLRLEYRLVSNIIDSPQEFDEGIRALLIDKDNKPRWQPPVLEKVSFPIMRFFS